MAADEQHTYGDSQDADAAGGERPEQDAAEGSFLGVKKSTWKIIGLAVLTLGAGAVIAAAISRAGGKPAGAQDGAEPETGAGDAGGSPSRLRRLLKPTGRKIVAASLVILAGFGVILGKKDKPAATTDPAAVTGITNTAAGSFDPSATIKKLIPTPAVPALERVTIPLAPAPLDSPSVAITAPVPAQPDSLKTAAPPVIEDDAEVQADPEIINLNRNIGNLAEQKKELLKAKKLAEAGRTEEARKIIDMGRSGISGLIKALFNFGSALGAHQQVRDIDAQIDALEAMIAGNEREIFLKENPDLAGSFDEGNQVIYNGHKRAGGARESFSRHFAPEQYNFSGADPNAFVNLIQREHNVGPYSPVPKVTLEQFTKDRVNAYAYVCKAKGIDMDPNVLFAILNITRVETGTDEKGFVNMHAENQSSALGPDQFIESSSNSYTRKIVTARNSMGGRLYSEFSYLKQYLGNPEAVHSLSRTHQSLCHVKMIEHTLDHYYALVRANLDRQENKRLTIDGGTLSALHFFGPKVGIPFVDALSNNPNVKIFDFLRANNAEYLYQGRSADNYSFFNRYKNEGIFEGIYLKHFAGGIGVTYGEKGADLTGAHEAFRNGRCTYMMTPTLERTLSRFKSQQIPEAAAEAPAGFTNEARGDFIKLVKQDVGSVIIPADSEYGIFQEGIRTAQNIVNGNDTAQQWALFDALEAALPSGNFNNQKIKAIFDQLKARLRAEPAVSAVGPAPQTAKETPGPIAQSAIDEVKKYLEREANASASERNTYDGSEHDYFNQFMEDTHRDYVTNGTPEQRAALLNQLNAFRTDGSFNNRRMESLCQMLELTQKGWFARVDSAHQQILLQPLFERDGQPVFNGQKQSLLSSGETLKTHKEGYPATEIIDELKWQKDFMRLSRTQSSIEGDRLNQEERYELVSGYRMWWAATEQERKLINDPKWDKFRTLHARRRAEIERQGGGFTKRTNRSGESWGDRVDDGRDQTGNQVG